MIVAAGDIGIGLQGIDWLKRFDRPTIYVAGNHEYYGGDLVHTRAAIAEATAASHVHFLENAAAEIAGVRFLGATLWTDYRDGDDSVMQHARTQMNDFLQIRCASRELTPEQIYDINWESRFWLARELDRPFAGKTVVVTHHAPSMRSWPYADGSDYPRNILQRPRRLFRALRDRRVVSWSRSFRRRLPAGKHPDPVQSTRLSRVSARCRFFARENRRHLARPDHASNVEPPRPHRTDRQPPAASGRAVRRVDADRHGAVRACRRLRLGGRETASKTNRAKKLQQKKN